MTSDAPAAQGDRAGEAWRGEDDLARLEALLAADPHGDAALPPDEMQGFFCARAIGPEPPSATHAIADALGDVPDEAASHDPELVALCARLLDDTVHGVREGALSPIVYEKRRGRLDYATWCAGFLEGALWWDDHWPGTADPDEVDELLFPIRVVADALEDDEKRAYRPAQWRRLLLDSERTLLDQVYRLRDYWAIARAPPRTLRRESAKVGRNDPCPCGSGRKYKHCHGDGR